ncbi:hypothetical protein TRIATDRAFT_260217 [Trichoderma atroviride IMI 206040]|uniref:Uncharacterized protein n=1 Tax=Hypocrea atroviridis (strain ATCC 20476 / IMI 206040) TaxID=452589 RepID=G9PCB1_HYPAI|nr:uncharacterized protein TRIATDRAFT_260217 [Trichoderma atroviride IMI 206040]EHK39485.1 hypothetical protein TRIATDRAFT_260217 [Trichoderma atroviride IMI 206040]
MPSGYIFTESAPSQSTFYRSGRGGAGNTFRTTSSTSSSSSSSSSPAATFTPRQLPSQRFFSGIGGAGNVHQAAELQPAILRSLETPADHNPSVGYVGRGGAGNVYRRKTSDAGSMSSADSASSSVSDKAKLWATRVASSFGRK